MPEGRFSRTLAVSLGGSVIGAALAFVLAAVVGRSLGAGGTGTYFQLVAVFTVAVASLKLGADTGLVRSLSQLVALGRGGDVRRTVLTAMLPVLAVSVVVSLVVAVGAPAWAQLLSGDPGQAAPVTNLLRYLAPFLVIASTFYVGLGGIRGLGSVVGYSLLLNIGLPTARLALVAGALGLGMGAIGAVQAWVIALPVLCAVTLVALRRAVGRVPLTRPSPVSAAVPAARADPGGARGFWSFSLGRWAAATVEALLDWVDVILVGALTDPASAGAYAIATRVARAGQVVDNAMRVAVGPRLAAMLATRDLEGADRLFRVASQAMVALTVPFYATCIVFAPTILGVFGEGFASAAPALRVLCAGMVLSAATIMLQSVVLMGGRSHWQLMNKSAALVVAVLANLALIPVMGIVGAATAWLLAILTDVTLVSVQTYRLTGIRPRVREVGLPLVVVGGLVALVAVIMLGVLGQTLVGLAAHLALVGLLYLAGGVAVGVRTKRVNLRRLRPR